MSQSNIYIYIYNKITALSWNVPLIIPDMWFLNADQPLPISMMLKFTAVGGNETCHLLT